MKKFNTILGIAAAASLTGSSLAGIVSLSVAADSIGSGLYAGYTGAKITITMNIDDTASAVAGEITSNWSIAITQGSSTLLAGTGTSSFTVFDMGGSTFKMESALLGGVWTVVGGLTPEPNQIQISYAGEPSDTLLAAISASAGTTDGRLTVGTISGSDVGALIGEYTVVPAPSALVLLAGGLVLARRRRA